ncbi:MAG: MarR family winged helix-turn-helix transcriptional regulator [Novosphingobium sp.]
MGAKAITSDPGTSDPGPTDATHCEHGARDIGVRFAVISRMMRQEFDRRVSDIGVTRSQWTMFLVVARRPGATQREIANALEMSEASTGRLIDRLCADGLLIRKPRNNDRRAHSVCLTAQAQPLLSQIGEIARASENRVFRSFSDEELLEFSRLLDKLYTNLGGGDTFGS